MQGQQQKKRNQAKEKSARTQAIKPKIFDLPSKTLSRYQTNILLRGLSCPGIKLIFSYAD